MKIEPSQTIRISGGKSSGLSKKTRTGSEITAKIIRTLSHNEAVIEIGGKRLRAEFTGSIPDSNQVILRLVEKQNNSFLFRLIEKNPRNELYNELFNHSLLDKTENPSLIYNLKLFLSSSFNQIYEMNLILMGLGKKENREGKVSQILNRLLVAGIPIDSLETLSFLITGNNNSGIQLLQYILFFLIKKKSHDKTEPWSNDNIKKLLLEIDNLIDAGDGNDIIWQLAVLLEEDKHSSYPYEGETAFFEENCFIPIKYIVSKESVLLSIDFSALGHIDILGKKTDDKIYINIYTETEETHKELHSKLKKIMEELNSLGIQTTIRFLKSSVVLKQLFEMSNRTDSGQLDIKA